MATRPYPKLTQETKNRVIKLFKDGLTMKEVVAKTGHSWTRVEHIRARYIGSIRRLRQEPKNGLSL